MRKNIKILRVVKIRVIIAFLFTLLRIFLVGITGAARARGVCLLCVCKSDLEGCPQRRLMLYFFLPCHATVGGKLGLWHLTPLPLLPHPGPNLKVLPFSGSSPASHTFCAHCSLCLEYPSQQLPVPSPLIPLCSTS